MTWRTLHFTPLWFVWLLGGGLVAVVLGLVVRSRRRGDSVRDTVGMSAFTLLMTVVYASSFLLAPLATALSSPTRVDWWQMAAVRVGWQLGGGVLLAVALVWEAREEGRLGDRRVWLAAVGLMALGGALCVSALRDLLDGPLVLRGRPALQVEQPPGGRGGGAVFATLTLRASDGATREVDLSGWAATRAAAQLAACAQGDELTVTILRHADAVLEVTCPAR